MPVDPRHGQDIPAGQQIARALRAFLRQIGAVVLHALHNRNRPKLSQFIEPMVTALAPLLRKLFARGRLNTLRRLRRLVTERAAAKKAARIRSGAVLATVRLKAPSPVPPIPPIAPPSLEIAFDVFLPQVELQLQRMVLQFVESTLRTAAVDAETAYQQTRAELMRGLSEGEALQSLNARVGQIFNDPMRAHRIAMTEASRAMHAGQAQAAAESGIVSGLKWLASSDACERCLELDGKQVPLGSPFYVDPKGGPYAVVEFPPLHPHCMCTAEEVLA